MKTGVLALAVAMIAPLRGQAPPDPGPAGSLHPLAGQAAMESMLLAPAGVGQAAGLAGEPASAMSYAEQLDGEASRLHKAGDDDLAL